KLMTLLSRKYPAYTWERNAGYTTRAHVRGLDAAGITPHHRKSFVRVSQLMLQLDGAIPDDLAEASMILDEMDATISEAIATL
ncbi:MAG TPA: hypothetical protein VFT21_02195, partial [Gemmatimonadaceae bacterium]|nr:hypothetical protein [Gemmatimonadaceae bacterium]